MKKSLMLLALTVAILLMGVAYAFADTVIVQGTGSPNQTATDTVTVKATVSPKLTLTVTTVAGTQTVDFGTVDPGTAPASQNVTVNVKSNKSYNITSALGGQSALMGLSTLTPPTLQPKTASATWTDTYSLAVPWTTDPASYVATVLYTVTQY